MRVMFSLLVLSSMIGSHPSTITSAADADQSSAAAAHADAEGYFNLPIKTAGGLQCWTDYRWRSGWRVQQNALTGHWRLIDDQNVRRAWGSKPACLKQLDRLCPSVESTPKHYVVLLHGLSRTRSSMNPLEKALRAHGFNDIVKFSYASTRRPINEHAGALGELVADLPADATFSFVGHSLGNIVVRHLVADLHREADPANILGRSRGMVMLGPPNQGADIARRLAPTQIFGLVTGPSGLELGARWDAFGTQLATPPFPFHVIAGDVWLPMSHPLVDGEHDLVVSVDEAKLEGAETFEVVPVSHTYIMSNQDVIEMTIDHLAKH